MLAQGAQQPVGRSVVSSGSTCANAHPSRAPPSASSCHRHRVRWATPTGRRGAERGGFRFDRADLVGGRRRSVEAVFDDAGGCRRRCCSARPQRAESDTLRSASAASGYGVTPTGRSASVQCLAAVPRGMPDRRSTSALRCGAGSDPVPPGVQVTSSSSTASVTSGLRRISSACASTSSESPR